MDNTRSQLPTLNQWTSDDEYQPASRKEAIIQMVKAMQADYGRAYQSQFHDEAVLRDYKNRLLTKIKDFPSWAIVTGYELAALDCKRFCPTIQQIVDGMTKVTKGKDAEQKKRIESERIAALPPPKISCDPKEILVSAKQSTEEMNKEQRQALHKKRLADHEIIMRVHMMNVRYDKTKHSCAVSFCQEVGTISHGTTGGGNFYCREHFRRT